MLGPDGEPLDVEATRRRRGRGDRGRLARRRGERPAQPAGRHRRAGPPAARDPARLPQVPPAGRLALHRGLPERRAGGELGADGQARALLRGALRPVARARRGGRAGAARGDPRRPRRGRLARPRPHPAQPARADRRDAAHERVPATDRGGDRVQAALGRRAGDAAARRRCTRSTSTRPRWRASTCAAAGSRAAGSAGATGWTTAPRSTA